MSGFVYFLVNPAMPALVKIGHTTTSVESRIRDLNSTAVPAPFEVAASFKVPDSATTEKVLHQHLNEHRVKENREFFRGPTAVLLELSFPILLAAVAAYDTSTVQPVPFAKIPHALSDRAVRLLQRLSGSYQYRGTSFYDMVDNREPELPVQYELASLKAMGLVKERRATNEYRGTTWLITSEGVKFLFDNALVNESMLQPPRRSF